tara:strand:- start:488 stop:1777 length:1290 start_codon:yes stop_codon:yes gene_type:complete
MNKVSNQLDLNSKETLYYLRKNELISSLALLFILASSGSSQSNGIILLILQIFSILRLLITGKQEIYKTLNNRNDILFSLFLFLFITLIFNCFLIFKFDSNNLITIIGINLIVHSFSSILDVLLITLTSYAKALKILKKLKIYSLIYTLFTVLISSIWLFPNIRSQYPLLFILLLLSINIFFTLFKLSRIIHIANYKSYYRLINRNYISLNSKLSNLIYGLKLVKRTSFTTFVSVFYSLRQLTARICLSVFFGIEIIAFVQLVSLPLTILSITMEKELLFSIYKVKKKGYRLAYFLKWLLINNFLTYFFIFFIKIFVEIFNINSGILGSIYLFDYQTVGFILLLLFGLEIFYTCSLHEYQNLYQDQPKEMLKNQALSGLNLLSIPIVLSLFYYFFNTKIDPNLEVTFPFLITTIFIFIFGSLKLFKLKI